MGNISHAAVAVDSVSGKVFIVYYDAVDGDLWWARTVNNPANGNCGPGNSWKCEALFPWQLDAGKYCSIAVHPHPGGGVNFIVPFYSATTEHLMYVGGYATEDGFTARTETLDTGFMATDRTGMYTAVQYDWNGNPWIAYQNETYGSAFGTHHMIARWRGDGLGNCGVAPITLDWECHDLFNNGFAQSFSSTGMALDLQGRPVVAFYDDHENRPVVAWYQGPGGGGGCGPSGDWKCYNVRPRDGDTDAGRHVVPFVDPDGRLTIYYQNSHRDSLEKATYYGSHGESNCGFNSTGLLVDEWKCETIDSMDGIFMDRGIDVAADPFGYPIVAYQYGSDPGPGALAVARPVASPDVDSGGGCLPVAPTWSCDIIDSGGSYLNEAFSVSIATTPSGGKFIAYDEVDDYPFPEEHNLKLATMPGTDIFADGFEGGNTSAWSVTVP